MKPNSYTLTYWVMTPHKFSVDIAELANLIIKDCKELSQDLDIDGMLEHFNDNIDAFLLDLGFPSEALDEFDDYMYDKIYEEVSGDLATAFDELLNS